MKTNKFKNIIIFSSGGIGDFVLATSAISLIRDYDKDINITLILCKGYESLVSEDLKVNELITLNRKYHTVETSFIFRLIYKLVWILKVFRKLYKKDVIIFFDYSKLLINFAKYIFKIKKIIDEKSINESYTHLIMKYQILVRKIFPSYNLYLPLLPNTNNLKQNLKQKYFQNTKKYAMALCTRTSLEIKNWDLNYFSELINKINKIYDITFYILGNTKKEIENGEYLIKSNKDADIRNLSGKTSLLELKEILTNMNLLVSVDTSVVHFAAVNNIPTISMYGFSLPSIFGPINHNAVCLFSGEECSPCIDKYFSNKLKCKYPKCMQNIKPNIVFEEVTNILNNYPYNYKK